MTHAVVDGICGIGRADGEVSEGAGEHEDDGSSSRGGAPRSMSVAVLWTILTSVKKVSTCMGTIICSAGGEHSVLPCTCLPVYA